MKKRSGATALRPNTEKRGAAVAHALRATKIYLIRCISIFIIFVPLHLQDVDKALPVKIIRYPKIKNYTMMITTISESGVWKYVYDGFLHMQARLFTRVTKT